MNTQRLLALLLLASPAVAQDFNVDVGPNLILWPAPSASYAAGAGQAGVWNPVPPSLLPTALVDLAGAPTGVSVTTTETMSYSWPFSGLTGDDDAFTADGQALDALLQTPATWTFSGLADGSYLVYTYAWDAAGSGVLTEVRIPSMPGSEQLVGGTWLGSPHVLGVTYALHAVTVSGGTLVVEARSAVSGSGGEVIGFQLVQTSSGSPFTGYCFGDGSGTACPCGNAGGAGEGCANSSGAGATLGAIGSTSASVDDQVFQAGGLLPNRPALLFVGDNAVNGGNGTVFGDGLRCAGGNIVRLGVRVPDALGAAHWGPGLAAQGGWSAGQTKRFQVWYRDPIASPCGSAFNLTNGLEVGFTN
ncbi:MAG: hypothetical protein H6828_12560 [Planctomycetes bacterium]|nr:hypothetical protein [Planctomycetota bacterium]